MVEHNWITKDLWRWSHQGHQEAVQEVFYHQLCVQWYWVGETVPWELFDVSKLFQFLTPLYYFILPVDNTCEVLKQSVLLSYCLPSLPPIPSLLGFPAYLGES